MSLIVDINPVPWEILDLVRARILKNRAKKQKRQPEKGKELRRVMQVDNGILAKQRWEDPSFVGGGGTPFLVILKTFANQTFAFTLTINDVLVAEIDFREMGNKKGYILLWTNNENDEESIKTFIGPSRVEFIEEGYLGRFYDYTVDFTNPYNFFSLVDNTVKTGYRGVNLIPYTLFWDYTVITINGNEPSPGSSIDIETQVTYGAQYTRAPGTFHKLGFSNRAAIFGGLVYGAGDIVIGDYLTGFDLYYDDFGLANYGVGQIKRFTFRFSDE
jgi:hypothetical protein